MQQRVQGEWGAVTAGAILAGIGWGVHATLLALAGTLVALVALLLWAWQRYCLDGVTYRRTLERNRADFGERIVMELELVNDKLLPLTWLHVRDEAPGSLRVEGPVNLSESSGWRRQLQLLVPLLPYQRLRRRVTIVCDNRGDHFSGPLGCVRVIRWGCTSGWSPCARPNGCSSTPRSSPWERCPPARGCRSAIPALPHG